MSRFARSTAAIIALSVVLVAALEVSVRLIAPSVNLQGTQMSLLREHAFGDSVGWRPNARGISFGKTVNIDGAGFRRHNSPSSGPTWLILGDSVTFGPGVDSRDTFVHRLQDVHPKVRIINTAVVGYSARNYLDVVNTIMDRQPPERVLLFFSLNDVYGDFDQITQTQTLRGWLRSHSKLYVLLKGRLLDRSRSFFEHDRAYYDPPGTDFRQTVNILLEIRDRLASRNIPLDVVLMPYEYQLRVNNVQVRNPQRRLLDSLRKLGIRGTDLYDGYRSTGEQAKTLFLFGDPMHFSVAGHAETARLLNGFLRHANDR